MDLRDKAAIVTGAGSGIGRAIAVAYAREGARVVVSDIAEEGGRETVRLIEGATPGAQAIFVRADVAKPEDHEALVSATVERFGALHIACNNAGIGGEQNPVGDLSIDGWRQVIEVSLRRVLRDARADPSHARIRRRCNRERRLDPRAGRTVGSRGVRVRETWSRRSHARGRARLREAGIRINSVGPAYIDTPLLAGIPADVLQSLIAAHPIGRLGRPEEVAELAVWLSSDRASFVTGDYYPIDGGYLAQ